MSDKEKTLTRPIKIELGEEFTTSYQGFPVLGETKGFPFLVTYQDPETQETVRLGLWLLREDLQTLLKSISSRLGEQSTDAEGENQDGVAHH